MHHPHRLRLESCRLGAAALFFLLALPTALLAVANPPVIAAAAPKPADAVLIKGDHFTISRSQLEEEQRVHQHEVQEMLAEGFSAPAVAWRVVQSLVNKNVVLTRVTEADRREAQASFDTNSRAHKATMKLTDEAFEQLLAQQLPAWGLSRRRWEERSMESYLVNAVMKRETGAGITDADVAKYYEERLVNFDVPEKIRAIYVLLSTVDRRTGLRLSQEQMATKRAQLESILARARAGEDLGALARQYSEAGPAKDPGGLYVFHRGQSTAEFEAVAFSLPAGEISDVITTDSGYQIIQVKEKTPARRLGLAEMASRIRDSIMFERSASYLQRFKDEAHIQIVDPELKAEAARTVAERNPS